MSTNLRLSRQELATVFGLGSGEQLEATLCDAGVDLSADGTYDFSAASAVFREKDQRVIEEVAGLLDRVRHDGDAAKLLTETMTDTFGRTLLEEWRRSNPTLAQQIDDAGRAICDRLEGATFYGICSAKWSAKTAKNREEHERGAWLWRMEIDILREQLLAAMVERRRPKAQGS